VVNETNSKVLQSKQCDPQEEYRANFDISKAKKHLDWMPKITLKKGIEDLIENLEGKI